MHDRSEKVETVGQQSAIESEVPREWQFSLRGLMIATTVVSVIMALGTYLVGAAFVIFVVVLVETASLLSFEWLIRPANRRFLAFTTAGSWAVLGSGLLIIGVKVGTGIVLGNTDPEFWAAVVAFSIFAVACYGFAWHRWRQRARAGVEELQLARLPAVNAFRQHRFLAETAKVRCFGSALVL